MADSAYMKPTAQQTLVHISKLKDQDLGPYSFLLRNMKDLAAQVQRSFDRKPKKPTPPAEMESEAEK